MLWDGNSSFVEVVKRKLNMVRFTVPMSPTIYELAHLLCAIMKIIWDTHDVSKNKWHGFSVTYQLIHYWKINSSWNSKVRKWLWYSKFTDHKQVSVELCDGELTEKETEKLFICPRARMYSFYSCCYNVIKERIYRNVRKTTWKIFHLKLW